MGPPAIATLLAKPRYGQLAQAYLGPEYQLKKFVLCSGVTNQCAIRMSVALGRSGYSLEGFQEPKRVHGTALRPCPLQEPHIVGATELMKYLVTRFGQTSQFKGAHQVHRAYDELHGRRGIVYFENLGHKTGDHIDLFDGTAIYNELRDYRDHGHEGGHAPTDARNLGRRTKDHYFARAEKIQFIQLA